MNIAATAKLASLGAQMGRLGRRRMVLLLALVVGIGWSQPSIAGTHTDTECQADVVFLMDNSGSMTSMIKTTKTAATEILGELAGGDDRFKGVDIAFGVATYWGDPSERDGYAKWRAGYLKAWYAATWARSSSNWMCGPTSSYPSRGTSWGHKYLFRTYSVYRNWRCDYGTPADPSDDHKSKCRILGDNHGQPEICDVPGAGWVFVADQGNHRIQKFTDEGDWVTSWGSRGSGIGEFKSPQGIALAGGLIYVADSKNHRIQTFDQNGNSLLPILTTTGATGTFKRNEQITGSVSGAKGRVVSDSKSQVTYRSLSGSFTTSDVLTGEGGTTASVDTIERNPVWGEKGTDQGELKEPTWIGVDTSGNIYVTEKSQNRVQKFDKNGKYLLKLNGTFSLPRGIALDSDDDVYVVDKGNHRIQKFNSSGNLVTEWANGGRLGSAGSAKGLFNAPQGIAIDSDNNLYVTDGGNYRVQKFDKTGKFVRAWGKRSGGGVTFRRPRGIGINNANEVHVIDEFGGGYQQFSSDGKLLAKVGREGAGNAQFRYPKGIAVVSQHRSNEDILQRAKGSFKVYGQLTKDKSLADRSMKLWRAQNPPAVIVNSSLQCVNCDWPEGSHFALHQLATEGSRTDGEGKTDEGFFSCGKRGLVIDPDWRGDPNLATRVAPWELSVDKRKRACKEGSIGWRKKSKKTIVVIGDAPPHHTTVDVDEAIQALGEQGISVVHLNTQKPFWGLDTCMDDKRRFYRGRTRGKCGRPGYAVESEPSVISYDTGGVIKHRVEGKQAVLTAVLQGVAASVPKAGSQAAVTFSGQTVTEGLLLFETSFNGDGWYGDLLAKKFDPDVKVEVKDFEVLWSANGKMKSRPKRLGMTSDKKDGAYKLNWSNCKDRPRCRNDFITDAGGVKGDEAEGEERLSWLLLERSQEGKRLRARKGTHRGPPREEWDSLMGDIFHSSPVYVGQAAGPWRDDHSFVKKNNPYSKFVDKTKNRTPHIYVGSNGGPLHAFDAKTGRETFAYFPRELFSDKVGKGYHYLSEPEFAHKSLYVDGSPKVNDALMKDGKWHTVLVGTLGSGGRGMFALDVTEPDTFTSTGNWQPYLWEFGNKDDDHFGYSHGQPAILALNNGKFGVLVGNGPRSTSTDETGLMSQLFILDIDGPTGPGREWIEDVDYVRIATDDDLGGFRNAAFSPTGVDLDGNGTVDRVYMGDAGSTIWAFDLSSKDKKKWKVDFDGAPLFQGQIETDASGVDAKEPTQPFTAPPLVTLPPAQVIKAMNNRSSGASSSSSGSARRAAGDFHKNGLMIYIGSGTYIEDGDGALDSMQSFYAVHDRGVGALGHEHLVPQKFLESSSIEEDKRVTDQDIEVNYNKHYGWYLNLPDRGERVVTSARMYGELVMFTSMVPDASVCGGSGHGWEMMVNGATGGPPDRAMWDTDNNSVINAADVGEVDGKRVNYVGAKLSGLPGGSTVIGTSLITSVSREGEGETKKTELADPEDCSNPKAKCGRRSWVELRPRY